MTIIREVGKVLEMSVSFMEECNGNVRRVKGVKNCQYIEG